MENEKGKPFRLASRREEAAEDRLKTWKILIVDDEEEVHRVSRLVLEGKVLVDRRLELVSAHSAGEARELLAADDTIACILLDVVMETEDAGLELVRYIRKTLGNTAIRIILRTGQPGQAPEYSVIREYEINDYKEKTELTVQKLLTSVTAALRSYRDIRTIEESKRGLEMIIEATSSIFRIQSMMMFASGILKQLISILQIRDAAFFNASGFTAASEAAGLHILAGTGRYLGLVDSYVSFDDLGTGAESLRAAFVEKRTIYANDRLVVYIEGRSGGSSVLYVEGCPALSEMDMKLVEIYCRNLSEAFSNIELYGALEKSLEEKTALLQEIHHRVRNNLQIILSLISIEEEGGAKDPWRVILKMKSSIESMAEVHENVYSLHDVENVDFAALVPLLVKTATSSRLPASRAVEFSTAVEPFTLTMEKAIPLSLLVNELIEGCIDFALEEGNARKVGAAISLLPGTRTASLVISCEGKPDSGTIALNRPASSEFGIVRALCTQLGGELSVRTERGLEIRFTCNLEFVSS
jgi:two-component sensor histidine kinase/CheY-like chemotaxis protein